MTPASPRVLLLCGGQSGEHDVSLASARSVLEAAADLDVTPLVIGRDGRLLSASSSRSVLGLPAATYDRTLDRSDDATRPLGTSPGATLPDGTSPDLTLPDATRPDGTLPDGVSGRAATLVDDGVAGALSPLRGRFDVVFPLLHGPYGEDGSVQGLLKTMGLPFVGSGVLGSAVGMDKLTMKAVFAAHGLPQVAYRGVTRSAWSRDRAGVAATLRDLPMPLFVKPANLGSSIGIRRVDEETHLQEAVDHALAFDRRVIVEQGVVGARELEVAVLGNDEPQVSPVGEIRYGTGFYDYDTKYTDGRAELIIPAALPAAVAERGREMALRAFQAVDAAGMARVDFFLLPDGETLLLNEINTIPGFTRHSMYPRLWAAAGLSYSDLVRRLVTLALEAR
ncbi:MAG: D-alanine--D-alanine ligase family protein [Trueperaceae bacterium]